MKKIIVVALLVVTSIVLASSLPDGRHEAGRTIVITAKDMMFNETNPTIEVAPGETIRLVFRNEDPGMKHDLFIPVLDLRTGVIEAGDQAVLVFRAPKRGSFDYLCSLHPVSMRGAIDVSPDWEVVAEQIQRPSTMEN